MRIAWRHYRMPQSGIARGYLTAGYHLHRTLRERIGQRLVDVGAAGGHPRLVLHFCPPHFFAPIPGKVNVLFSMWEADVLPREFVEILRRADRLIVPSRYCRDVWRAHGLEAEIVPFGVHPAFCELESHRPQIRDTSSRLRFLCVGSPIARKGWALVPPAWRLAFAGKPIRAELYIKTFRQDDAAGEIKSAFGGTVTVDTRDLEPQELLDLYASADVYVHPSYGEGFGMTVLEAMAAGCLALAPHSSGLTEFVGPETALLIGRSGRAQVEYGSAKQTMAVPTEEDVARALALAYAAWGKPELNELRIRGTLRARSFTWERAAERLEAVLSGAISQSVAPEPQNAQAPAGGPEADVRMS